MRCESKNIEFSMTLELTLHEAAMLSYLFSLGGAAVKGFAGDRFTLEQWEALAPAMRKELERFLERAHHSQEVWSGVKVAARLTPKETQT